MRGTPIILSIPAIWEVMMSSRDCLGARCHFDTLCQRVKPKKRCRVKAPDHTKTGVLVMIARNRCMNREMHIMKQTRRTTMIEPTTTMEVVGVGMEGVHVREEWKGLLRGG